MPHSSSSSLSAVYSICSPYSTLPPGTTQQLGKILKSEFRLFNNILLSMSSTNVQAANLIGLQVF